MARNTNRQGANFELDVMHYLSGCECEGSHRIPKHIGWRGFGYDCSRSSGSHGAVDVFAIAAVPGPPLFIQCKISNPLLSPAERRKVQDWASRALAVPLVCYRAQDIHTGRIRPHFRRLTGQRPRDWVLWEPGEDN